MTDRYQQFARSNLGRRLVRRLGLPDPVPLRRYEPGQPLLTGPVLLGGSGRLRPSVEAVLHRVDASVYDQDGRQEAPPEARFGALLFDASGITSCAGLRDLYDFFHPTVRRVLPSGRVIVFGTPPEKADSVAEATAQRAVEGFVRSLGKEAHRGITAQLVYVDGPDSPIESTLRFLLSAKSAYVSGQVIRIGPGRDAGPSDWDRPLAGTVALVTGAARGIGASIAEVFGRDGAHVVCLDLPAQGAALAQVANRVGGSSLQLDITRPDAPRTLADHLRARHGGVDIVVHNAGITRDKTLGRMQPEQWDQLMEINLCCQERIDQVLLDEEVIRPGGRIVGLSSTNGIAGQFGQTNYATSKAGVIGRIAAMAPVVAERGVTVNGVAPGFIETQMTAALPATLREIGRRLNSMAQGGRPADVAETIAWLASPGSSGINGSVVRVCGQSILGA